MNAPAALPATVATSTPVPPTFRFTWSFGSVSAFESCPLRYYHEKVAKTVPYVKSEQTLWGEDVHTALETSAKTGQPLPSNMSQYQPTLAKVQMLAEEAQHVEYERQFAVTRESKPCGWWGDNVFARCAADVFMTFDGWYGVIIDYKTGKPHNPRFGMNMQPVINAKLAFDHFPDLQQVDTSFVYMAHDKTSKQTFTRKEISIDFQPVGELIYQMETAVQHQNFPARKNGLCRKHCPVTSCAHNGRYGQ